MSGILSVPTAPALARLRDVNDAAKADQFALVWDSATSKHVYLAVMTGAGALNDAGTTTADIWSASKIQTVVDAAVVGLYDHKGAYNASTNSPDLDTAPSGILKGDAYTVDASGTFYAVAVEAGDVLIADQDSPTLSTHWTIVNRNIDSTAFATASHAHAAADITTGTLAHERGGLEFDVSAVAIGDVIAGTGAGTMAIVAASGASDGDVLTVQADGTVAFETGGGGGGGDALTTGDVFTGAHDFGGADSLEIPNSAAPTVNAAGEIAIDTSITDHVGLIKYHDGVEELTVLALPTANLTTTDQEVLGYNATTDELEFIDVVLPYAESTLGGAASGDVLYHDGTSWTNLAKGSDDAVLTLASGIPSWAAGGGGGGLSTTDIDTLAELNAIITDATLIDTADSRLSDARTPTAHNQAASTITTGTLAHERGGLEFDASAVAIGDVIAGTGTGTLAIVAASGASDGDVLTVQASGTVAFETIQSATASVKGLATAAQITKLDGLETSATADQLDAEIETAYNTQVSAASKLEMEAGTVTAIRRMTPERVKQAIDAQNEDVSDQSLGVRWAIHTTPEANQWKKVAYGNGKFVAVAIDGTNRVMTSPDGITWTARSATEANSWRSVCWSETEKLFVAVASDGTNRVMTSPDGITWTARSAAEANSWVSVCYGGGLFVAVAYDGTNRVMTSPDGITWTARSAANAMVWWAVTNGGGLFVAVAEYGSGTDQVMTSPDGITWTARTHTGTNNWTGVVYGNGLFVAVSRSGTNRVMTSPDGITWTARTPTENAFRDVAFGEGLFAACNNGGSSTDYVATSPDGITWTDRTASSDSLSICFGNGIFVSAGHTFAKSLISGQRKSPHITMTDAATVTLEMQRFKNKSFDVTLGGNRTFAFDSPEQWGRYFLRLTQDATGSRTVTWPSSGVTINWAGGSAPTLTTTANKADRIVLVCTDATVGSEDFDAWVEAANV
jgi:hypothetical protein